MAETYQHLLSIGLDVVRDAVQAPTPALELAGETLEEKMSEWLLQGGLDGLVKSFTEELEGALAQGKSCDEAYGMVRKFDDFWRQQKWPGAFQRMPKRSQAKLPPTRGLPPIPEHEHAPVSARMIIRAKGLYAFKVDLLQQIEVVLTPFLPKGSPLYETIKICPGTGRSFQSFVDPAVDAESCVTAITQHIEGLRFIKAPQLGGPPMAIAENFMELFVRSDASVGIKGPWLKVPAHSFLPGKEPGIRLGSIQSFYLWHVDFVSEPVSYDVRE